MRRALLAVLGITVARVGMAQVPARLELVRCTAGSDAPCLRARVTLDASARAAVGALDSVWQNAAWSGEIVGHPLVGPGLGAAPAEVLPTRLLILIDRGAAMSGEGIACTDRRIRGRLPPGLISSSAKPLPWPRTCPRMRD